jgi:hypothetical protein
MVRALGGDAPMDTAQEGGDQGGIGREGNGEPRAQIGLYDPEQGSEQDERDQACVSQARGHWARGSNV